MARSDSNRITDGSLAVAVVRDLRQISNWFESSQVVRGYRRLAAKLGTTARASILHRWLAKAPDHDASVVDLRETYTIGPIITTLDRLQPQLGQAWCSSTLGKTVADVVLAAKEAPIRTVSVVLVAAVLTNSLVAAITESLTIAEILIRTALLTIAFAGVRVRVSLDALARARTIQILEAVLEPPESPDERRRD